MHYPVNFGLKPWADGRQRNVHNVCMGGWIPEAYLLYKAKTFIRSEIYPPMHVHTNWKSRFGLPCPHKQEKWFITNQPIFKMCSTTHSYILGSPPPSIITWFLMFRSTPQFTCSHKYKRDLIWLCTSTNAYHGFSKPPNWCDVKPNNGFCLQTWLILCNSKMLSFNCRHDNKDLYPVWLFIVLAKWFLREVRSGSIYIALLFMVFEAALWSYYLLHWLY